MAQRPGRQTLKPKCRTDHHGGRGERSRSEPALQQRGIRGEAQMKLPYKIVILSGANGFAVSEPICAVEGPLRTLRCRSAARRSHRNVRAAGLLVFSPYGDASSVFKS